MSRRAVMAGLGALVAFTAGVFGWQREPSASGVALEARAQKGAAVFRARGCVACHDGPDSSSRLNTFPSLAAPSSWAGRRRPGLSAAEYLTQSIRAPSAFISPAFRGSGGPTSPMPELGLSDAEIDAVVTYLLSAR